MPAGRSVGLPLRQAGGARGFNWDRTIAMFQGRDIAEFAECPTPDEPWFPQEICDGAVQVIAGTAHFRVAEVAPSGPARH